MELIVWCILLVNAGWDFVSLLAICSAIGDMHLGLWVNQTDQLNPAAIFLMSFGMLVMGAARLAACVDEHLWIVASFSYIIEFLFAVVGVYLRLIHAWKGVFVAISSALLAVIVAVFH